MNNAYVVIQRGIDVPISVASNLDAAIEDVTKHIFNEQTRVWNERVVDHIWECTYGGRQYSIVRYNVL